MITENFRWLMWLPIAFILGCATPPQTSTPTTPDIPAPSTTIPKKNTPKLGFAFGGGAAKGFAHVGVIIALEKAGIKPDLIVGTSAGSIIGALYASGLSSKELIKIVESFQESDIRDLTLSRKGVIEGKKLQDYVNDLVKNKPIESFPIPFGAVATNATTGEGVVFRKGNAGMAVRASSSVPGIFIPVKIGKHEYVDGGLASPVPVSFARQMGADIVIAIDISDRAKFNKPSGIISLLNQTFTIVQERILNQELKSADIVIQPDIREIGSTDLEKKNLAMRNGQLATERQLSAIKSLLQKKGWIPRP